jgi:hypothetical protein
MPPFETGNPGTGGEIRTAAQRLQEEIVQFCALMSTDAFFAPQGPSWSPAWHVRHLAKSNFPVAKAQLTVREMLFFTLYHNAHHMTIVARRLAGAA